MADRPSHEIETPVGKHKVMVRDYLTGGEKRTMMAELDETKRVTTLISVLIVSIDGKNESNLAVLDEMHGKDFDFVVLELGRVAEASSMPAEKKSS